MRAAGSILLLLVTAGVAWGQPPAHPDQAGSLSSLAVPGGAAALARAAGLDDSLPRGAVLLQVIRVMQAAPSGSDSLRDQHLARLREYLAALADVERARQALGESPFSADSARSPETRRAMEDVARAIGGGLDEKGGVWRLALPEDEGPRRRRQHLENAGIDISALAAAFNAGEAVALAVPADEAPLPLDVQTWSRLIRPQPGSPGGLLHALLADRRASLLYYAFMSLDAPTREFLGANESRLARLLEGNRPAILAAFGRSIRVHDGRVDVAGGQQAARLWEELLVRFAGQPESFILALLDREDGRVALLYDAIDHLDPPRQAFALGFRLPDEAARTDRLRALLAACKPSLLGWDPDARPFRRVPFDPVHLLSVVQVLPTGDLPPPAGRRFWRAVLSGSGLPDDPERLLESDEVDVDADAAWLVERICVAESVPRQQLFRTWTLGQRVFAGLAPAAQPQALFALRGVSRFQTLLLTLERIGITDPAEYAAAVRHAQRLSEIGNGDRAAIALRQFQGALAIVERVRFSRAISPDAARELVSALSRVPLADSDEYRGAIATWLDAQLRPALETAPARQAAATGAVASLESTLLAAMAGVSGRPSSPEVEWEGLQYRVDVAGAELARLVRMRRKQGGPGLDAVLNDLLEAVRLVGAGKSTPKAAEVRAALARVRAGDALLAGVLTSLAYAPHLGDPDGRELLAGDPAERHSFGFEERIGPIRETNPWRIPELIYGESGGWRMKGSVLGLDVGLAALALRRLATDLPPPPSGNAFDRSALAATVVLSNPFDVSNSERDRLAAAIRHGRARLAEVMTSPSALAAAARAAGVGAWWQQVLPWALAHEPERVPDFFLLSDLLRLGSAHVEFERPPDAWGAARLDTEGCLCLRFPFPCARETLAGRVGTSLAAEQSADLSLRIAEALADLGLPAELTRSIMALAAQDVLDTYRPAYSDDWTALGVAVLHLTRSRFEDYVAALTAGGPLIPDDREHAEDVRR
jgi:hypothetical protein